MSLDLRIEQSVVAFRVGMPLVDIGYWVNLGKNLKSFKIGEQREIPSRGAAPRPPPGAERARRGAGRGERGGPSLSGERPPRLLDDERSRE